MADRKISDLTALTTPAAGDYLPIVDISEPSNASKNKRITIEELLRGAPDGTAAAPGIAFESDPNTGIYSPGADQVAISTNGTERVEFGTSEVVFNDGGANYDFRIEGDTNADLFFVDASTDRVGLGTASPAQLLHVQSPNTNTAETIAVFGNQTIGTGLQVTTNGNLDWGFNAVNVRNLTFSTNQLERARIDSSGRLGLGTSSPGSLLHLENAAGSEIRITDTGAATTVLRQDSGIAYLMAESGNSANRTLVLARQTLSGGTILESARFDNDGRFLVGTSSDSGGALLQVNDNRIRVATAKTPSSASDTGTAGEICWDANYIYVCTATDTWKRTAISTW